VDKLVIIKIAQPNSHHCYPVALQVMREFLANDRILLEPQVEITGELPSAAALLEGYQNWYKSYLNLDLNARLEAKEAQVTNIALSDRLAQCRNSARKLFADFEHWLNAESFQPLRERLSSGIDRQDRVRIILQIDDPQLHHLPWQAASLFDRYGDTEVVISSTQFESLVGASPPKSLVRILAILGNSHGIDITADRQILEQLTGTQVEFLVEPQRQHLNDRLWEQSWDILFFAGHSASDEGDRTGRIFINPTDSLSLAELRFGLKKAIAGGLKIAIFNSCDGLGLAKALSDLHIPQVIVMREPVPDVVAQTFLKEFLRFYAQGNSFYAAVRGAREKLQGLEDRFPCATWLPTIYQQGFALPPSWQQLQGDPAAQRRRLQIGLMASFGTSLLIAALRFAGIFQSPETVLFDLTTRLKPSELQDAHLLVVEITRDDVDRQDQDPTKPIASVSLADRTLDNLIRQLERHSPTIVGLDIFLDHQIDPKYTSIQESLKSGRLISVCKVVDQQAGEKETQPATNAELFGFGDTLADGDGTMRRHLLAMDAQPGACNTPYAISTMLAMAYLQAQKTPITFKLQADQLQLGERSYRFLTAHQGGYQQIDDRGYQIFLNYRNSSSVVGAIPSISLQKLFALPDRELHQLISGKIILIGTTDSRYKDIAKTPFGPQVDNRCPEYVGSQCIPGVFLQAQMTSQLVNAALENRPLLWASPLWLESGMGLLLALGGVLIAAKMGNRWLFMVTVGSGVLLLGVSSVLCLSMYGYWFPLLPSLLCWVSAAGGYHFYLYPMHAHPFRSQRV
jgi:CHASE2 domain-containing sensor protein